MRAFLVMCVALLMLCLPREGAAQATEDDLARQECEAKGGRYEVGGRLRQFICFEPLPDAGESCEKASDCAGFCLSDTKQCSAVTPKFGCISHLDEAGQAQVICID
ncbi:MULTISPECIES: hypothetical protein [unclassified Ruegeria]|uniref:hypothetical protein n=1 Tax=unclassified Ruegeria TaxID=2625375 RepID=UPI001487AC39|nr:MULTISPECIES: hypothetical protein [unclassified Ruegeria]NOD78036.1 hypothetical protein [Ruegeria sp. HKCCD4332]NOD87620.1 hypothetical protein [Ruegeria sp. HKCCD4318]NOE15653.1 hypothetical protein [Ruegeria sp. HKCCD4318-2]NOG08656.1 hypothetical protein [Ruegeria sp. HKCCD4315]